MRPLSGYLSSFVQSVQGTVAGMIVAYVDYSIATGNEEFESQSNLT